MRKLVRVGLFAAAILGFVLASGTMSAQDKDKKKTPSIKEIMKKGHGSTGLLTGIAKEAKDGKWEEADNDAKLLKEFGEGLGKNKPPKGDADSWKKLTDKYKESTAAVAEAAGKKDADAVKTALDKLVPKSGSCTECHDAHKPGKKK